MTHTCVGRHCGLADPSFIAMAVIATDKREAVELDPLDQVFPNVVLGVSAARKGHDAERVV